MQGISTPIPGLWVVEPHQFTDTRGSASPILRADLLGGLSGRPFSVVHQTLVRSHRGVLRGLAYQLDPPQTRLIQAVTGAVFDVCVDVRKDSPTFGRWYGIELSHLNARQIFLIPGFAHGYVALDPETCVLISYDQPYAPAKHYGVLWNDADLAISWPLNTQLISPEHAALPKLADINPNLLPTYKASRRAMALDAASCFLSYAAADLEFARQLYRDLTRRGVLCWFAPENMRAGALIRDSLDVAIERYDKIIVVLSRRSIVSSWVEAEVEAALEKERATKSQVLIPIALDDRALASKGGWVAMIRRTRHIGEFSEWQSPPAYKRAFQKLLEAIHATLGQRSGSEKR